MAGRLRERERESTNERKREHSPIFSSDTVIRLQVENATMFHLRSVESDKIDAGGLPWQLCAQVEDCRRSHVPFLTIDLECNERNKSNMWSADAAVKFVLVNQNDNSMNVVYEKRMTFNFETTMFKDLLSWSQIRDPRKGFIKEDTLVIEAHISVFRTTGASKKPRFDFSEKTDLTDGILVIEGRHVHVGKQFLALNSPVFYSMFFGNFDEKTKNEIELPDVRYEEFEELLHAIYPSHKKVTEHSVEALLTLADRFEIRNVTDECEKFLMTDTTFSLCKRLVFADRFRLVKLQDRCLSNIEKLSQVKNIKRKDREVWDRLSDSAKVALLERVIENDEST